jgi:hypothetical protein
MPAEKRATIGIRRELYENKLCKKRINLIDGAGPWIKRLIIHSIVQLACALKMLIWAAEMAVCQKRI